MKPKNQTMVTNKNKDWDLFTGSLTIFVVISVLFDGLFAPVEYLSAVIIFLLVLLWAVFRQTILSGKNIIISCIFVTIVFITALTGVDRGSAIIEAYRYLLYVLLLLSFLQIPLPQIPRFYLLFFITGTLLALIGLTSLGTEIFISHGMGGQRLQGTFGYANTTAIYLLITIMLGLYLSSYQSGIRKTGILSGIFICAVALFLTGSRTVWLMWPLAIILSVIVAPAIERPYWAGMGITTALMGVVTGYYIHFFYVNHRVVAAYLILIIGLVLAVICLIYLQDYLLKHLKMGNKLIYLCGLLMLLGLGAGLVYMGTATGRTMSWNVSELQGRIIYYRDACSILRDHPWLGIGGGGWAALQYLYQTAYYNVTLVHNSILQVALDTGLTGLLLFLGLMIIPVMDLIRGRVQLRQPEKWKVVGPALLGALLFLSHSLVDVDLTFPGAAVLFIFFLAVPSLVIDYPHKYSISLPLQLKFITESYGRWIAAFLLAALIVGASALWGAACYELRGDKLANAGSCLQAIESYQKSLQIYPYSARTYNQMGMAEEKMARAYQQADYLDKARISYGEAHRLCPCQPRYLENLAYTNMLLGRDEQSAKYFKELCQNNPMVIRHYENLAYALVDRGEKKFEDSRTDYEQVLHIPKMIDQARERVAPEGWKLRNTPQLKITRRLSWKLGQAEYRLGNLARAQVLWKEAAVETELIAEMRGWAAANKVNLGLEI